MDSRGELQASLADAKVAKSLQRTGINSAVYIPNLGTSIYARMEVLSTEQAVRTGQLDLDSILVLSPFSKILRLRQYVPLDEEHCNFLNEDWRQNPSFRYATARMLSECIMMNARNEHGIPVNTIEAYGRTRSTDIYRESVRYGVVGTSLPDATRNHYNRVLPITTDFGSGIDKPKLVIGTDMFDGLITCSTRVDEHFQGDVNSRHEIEPKNAIFSLRTVEDY
ncbi:hypothetical protein BGZ46_004941 [Entomortierella lignicola]|nr:hypothetical protein BGZ46_004941 [Entomortierella lignicola]